MAKIRRRLTQDDVAMISKIDDVTKTYFGRDPERPDNRFCKARGRMPLEVRRAQQRMRTARWRADMDRRKAPTIDEVGRALVEALVTSDRDRLMDRTGAEFDLVKRTLLSLRDRGYSIDETKETLRRRRDRLVHPGDRRDEEAGGGLLF
ncbi:hypothetical protein M2171_002586 [Bradyrhizobium japonicum USDA 38]|uniref:hypothetical protein n=1 Tax=Bradyrhizobium japonicum TaxID=375 RepID=UPI0004807CC9|nr:hypothetical protein [Bradyrhizobium japonicum]MCS3893453.1 hypothetical protein [Bradyrhizobium japonicum USDA 38]MCS3945967.1 hypothetical protein [Bradyrhizobium japonicum]